MFDYQDSFTVKAKTSNAINLVDLDSYSLTRLYLPIIGVDSYSLYMILSSLPSEQHSIKLLLDYLGLTSIKILTLAFDKLEAVGLLKKYKKDKKDYSEYIFILEKPLSKDNFRKQVTLYKYLEGQIGSKLANDLTETNIVSNKYKDLTKSFDEVFETSIDNYNDFYEEYGNIAKDSESILKFKGVKFDYLMFKCSVNTQYFGEDLLEDNGFKKTICDVAFLYRLNELEMVEVVNETTTLDKEFNYTLLSNRAYKKYVEKYSNTMIKAQTTEQDYFRTPSVEENVLKLIDFCENHSTAEVLFSLSKITPSESEINIFEEVRKSTNFSQALINYMIYYTVKANEGKIYSFNYYMKVANTWARNNVKTVLDAHTYIKNELQKKQNNQNQKYVTKPTNQKSNEDWFDDYVNEVRNKQNAPKTNDDSFADAMNLFKKGS